MKNKKTNWDKSKFEYSDKKLKELLKKQNKIFEKSKFDFKKIANKKMSGVKKINYKDIVFEQSDFDNKSRLIYNDEINNLTTIYLIDIANHYYQMALKEAKEKYPDDEHIQNFKPKKITKNQIEKWYKKYLSGLNSSFYQIMMLQSMYLAYRVSNALNDNVKNATKDIDDKKKKSMRDRILGMNTLPMLSAYKIQKKKFANSIDDEFTNVINFATLQAYEDLGIEKVIRVAEIDDRTCEVCIKLDGKIYKVDEAPDIQAHPFCRCYYEIYIEK